MTSAIKMNYQKTALEGKGKSFLTSQESSGFALCIIYKNYAELEGCHQ